MENDEYKQMKEAHVSNLTGTTLSEVVLIGALMPSSLLLHSVLLTCFITLKNTDNIINNDYRIGCKLKFLIDFVMLILPQLLAMTLFSDSIVELHVVSLMSALALMIIRALPVLKRPSMKSLLNLQYSDDKNPRYISNTRVSVLILTAIAILAVDFEVFPRRFGKTETYGSGLMDTGVGMFVVSNALVSAEAKNPLLTRRVDMSKSLKSSIPLFIMGLARVLSTKSVDYQEHVSEYGLHWNFFFTLGVIKVVCTLLLWVTQAQFCGVISVSVALIYQHLLSNYRLRDILIHGTHGDGSHHGLLDGNREGLISTLGYVALYFAGIELGRLLFKSRHRVVKDSLWILLQLVTCLVISVISLNMSVLFVEPISRRMANLSYYLWTIMSTLVLLIPFLAVEIVVVVYYQLIATSDGGLPGGCQQCSPIIKQAENNKYRQGAECSCLLTAVNGNQLTFFLLANILTGIVNLTFNTLSTTDLIAVLIIISYMITLTGSFVILHLKNYKTKFW